jgi:hypothetical protein
MQVISDFHDRAALLWSTLYLIGCADPITPPDAVEERKYDADGNRTRSLQSFGTYVY